MARGSPGAVEGFIPALDHDGAGALIGGVHVDDPLLQRRRQGDGLKRGAGLIAGVNALVPPLALDGAVFRFADGLLVFLLGFVVLPLFLQLRQLLFQLALQLPVVEDAGLVGIVVRIRGHAQERPVIHIHHNSGSAVGGVELAEHGLHALFQGNLDVDVQGQHQVVAVLRVKILLILEQQGLVAVVLGRDGHAGFAGEVAVVFGLQAHAAFVVDVHKADHIGRHGVVGVIPLGIRLQVHSGEAVPLALGNLVPLPINLPVDKFPDFVRRLLLHLPAQNDISGLCVFHLFFNGFLVHPQDAAQPLGDVNLVPDGLPGIGLPFFQGPGRRLVLRLLLVLDELADPHGVQDHHLRRSGTGQDIVVLVVYGSPGGVDGDLPGLLVDGPGRHLVVAVDLEVVELPEQQQKSSDAQHQHHQQGPPADDLIGPPGGFALPVQGWGSGGVICHRPPPNRGFDVLMKGGSEKTWLPAPRRTLSGPKNLMSAHYSAPVSRNILLPRRPRRGGTRGCV